MMRPISVAVDRRLPEPPVVSSFTVDATSGAATLVWTDGTPVTFVDASGNPDLSSWGDAGNEIGFRVERATVAANGKVGAYSAVGTALANVTTFTDVTAAAGTPYRYRVVAFNAAGSSASAPVGGPLETPPAAPTNLVATLQTGPRVALSWRDNANNEAYFRVERAVDGGAFVLLATAPARNNTGNTSFGDASVSAGHAYQYRVAAVNSGGASAYATSGIVAPPTPPAAPANLAGSAVVSGKKANVTLTWSDLSSNESGFEIQRATNPLFTVGLAGSTVGAGTTTVTQTGLYRGVTYYFRVRAFNAGGSSAWSNVVSIVTP